MNPVRRLALLVILLCSTGWYSGEHRISIPVTGSGGSNNNSANNSLSPLDIFSLSVINHEASEVVGIYAAGLFSYPVLQQPNDKPSFVSTKENVVTEFNLAQKFDSIGLVAHNYLAGKLFDQVELDQEIVVIYGDGTQVKYKVTETRAYQALTPSSPYSSFCNVKYPDKVISCEELFYETYALQGKLILQTCISKGNNDSWGRLFIIAEIVEPHDYSDWNPY